MIDWNKYIGIPFKEKGRTLKGLDCYGLVWIVHKLEKNILLPKYDDDYFSSLHDKKGIQDLIKRETAKGWQKITSVKPLDTLIFKLKGQPLHVGMHLQKSTFIHVLTGCNVCIEDYTDPLWRNKLYGFYRYTGG